MGFLLDLVAEERSLSRRLGRSRKYRVRVPGGVSKPISAPGSATVYRHADSAGGHRALQRNAPRWVNCFDAGGCTAGI